MPCPSWVYTKIMKHKVLDGVLIWKQFEDLLIPGLRLSVIERALYSHLLRHSRLEGKPRVRFSIPGLIRVAGLSRWMIRNGLRRLLAKGALRLAQKGKWGIPSRCACPRRFARYAPEKSQRASHNLGRASPV
jgi:hypothetical protein